MSKCTKVEINSLKYIGKYEYFNIIFKYISYILKIFHHYRFLAGLCGCEGSQNVASVHWEKILVLFSLASVSSKLWFIPFFLLSVPAKSQQCSCCSTAGRLWDSSPPPNAPQPGHPICLPGKIWGCCSALQTGKGVVMVVLQQKTSQNLVTCHMNLYYRCFTTCFNKNIK